MTFFFLENIFTKKQNQSTIQDFFAKDKLLIIVYSPCICLHMII